MIICFKCARVNCGLPLPVGGDCRAFKKAKWAKYRHREDLAQVGVGGLKQRSKPKELPAELIKVIMLRDLANRG